MSSWPSSRMLAGLHVFLRLTLALILVNWRAATPAISHVEDGGLDAVAGTELVVAVCLAAIILMLLKRAGMWRGYLGAWRGNPLLAVFAGFALLSLLWSVSPFVSLHNLTVFALATLAGAYLGFRFRSRGGLRVLFWYGAVLAIWIVCDEDYGRSPQALEEFRAHLAQYARTAGPTLRANKVVINLHGAPGSPQ